ncbi:cytochrome c-type biogenesis ccda-like protein chloroplastic, partial [Trifolium pratense]
MVKFYAINEEMADSVFTLADGCLSDWFGGILFSAGQQANEAVLDKLSSLTCFKKCPMLQVLIIHNVEDKEQSPVLRWAPSDVFTVVLYPTLSSLNFKDFRDYKMNYLL